MNWDAIGAIGEVVGAAAVVISLMYLLKVFPKGMIKFMLPLKIQSLLMIYLLKKLAVYQR